MVNQSFRSQVVNMGVGDKLTVSLDDVAYDTIRSYASNIGFQLQRKYSTKRNAAERSYTITRTA